MLAKADQKKCWGSFWSRIRALVQSPFGLTSGAWPWRRASSSRRSDRTSCMLWPVQVQGSGGWLAGDASAWCLVWSPGPTDGVVKRLHDMGEYLERGAVVSFVAAWGGSLPHPAARGAAALLLFFYYIYLMST